MKKYWLAAYIAFFSTWGGLQAIPAKHTLLPSDTLSIRDMADLPILPARVSQRALPIQHLDAVLYPSVLPVPYMHVMEMLVGRIAGVRVSGGPLFYQVRIRGALGPPLVILDGMPFPYDNDGDFNLLLLTIPPMDVARIEVIKNPAEAAIYGPNAGNGVILIHTKRGTEEDE